LVQSDLSVTEHVVRFNKKPECSYDRFVTLVSPSGKPIHSHVQKVAVNVKEL